MPKSAKKVAKRVNQPSQDLPKEYYQIHSLLHTVRAIGHYEDRLCVLQHEIKQTNRLTQDLASELNLLLSSLPLALCVDEVDELRESANMFLKPSEQNPARTGRKIKDSLKLPRSKTREKQI